LKALVFDSFGGPEVLSYRDVLDPEPLAGHAIVRTAAIGLNFADVIRRRGTYVLLGTPPYIAGYEAAGTVESVVGEAPDGVFPGARVGFADSPFANAGKVRVPFDKLIQLPDDLTFEDAAAVLLQGLTAHYLVRDSHPLRAGDTALVYAAAGGVGLLLVQMIARLGGSAIGLVSSAEKRDAALAAGAREVLLMDGGWKDRVLAATGGRGVHVAYDSLGSTLLDSFDVVRTGGRVVFFGWAGGAPPMIDPVMVKDASKSLTGGELWNMLTSRDERMTRSAELFSWLRDGSVKPRIARSFALSEGAAAHAFLESRSSIGKILLLP
jgi:NADPH2:quinone reductase